MDRSGPGGTKIDVKEGAVRIAEIHVYQADLPVSGKHYRMSEGSYATLDIRQNRDRHRDARPDRQNSRHARLRHAGRRDERAREPDDVARTAVEKVAEDYPRLQIKVGGRPVELDIETIRKVWEATRCTRLSVDAKRALTSRDVLRIERECADIPFVFEQPATRWRRSPRSAANYATRSIWARTQII
jgi:L-alanine-DL-glutamate epimerase-like enolase superfamily enzyme